MSNEAARWRAVRMAPSTRTGVPEMARWIIPDGLADLGAWEIPEGVLDDGACWLGRFNSVAILNEYLREVNGITVDLRRRQRAYAAGDVRGPECHARGGGEGDAAEWHKDCVGSAEPGMWMTCWANENPTEIRVAETKQEIPLLAGHIYLFSNDAFEHRTPPGVWGVEGNRWFIRSRGIYAETPRIMLGALTTQKERSDA